MIGAIAICQPEFSRLRYNVAFASSARAAGLAVVILFSATAQAREISLSIERLESPSFAASKISATLGVTPELSAKLAVGELEVAGNNLRNVRLLCPRIVQTRDSFACQEGALESASRIPLNLSYSASSKTLEVLSQPAVGESWHFRLTSRNQPATLSLAVKNGAIARFAPWLPSVWPQLRAGTVNGTVSYDGERARGDLNIADFGFSDDSGQRAGEKIAVVVTIQARQHLQQWQWQGQLAWNQGDFYWHPLLLSGGGHVLSGEGAFSPQRIAVDHGRVELARVGQVSWSAGFSRTDKRWELAAQASNLDVSALYEQLAKPMLAGTGIETWRVGGRADIGLAVADGALTAIDIEFKGLSLEDKEGHFALLGIDGELPWRNNAERMARFKVTRGQAWGVPLGPFELALALRGTQVRSNKIEVPVLDGKLIVHDLIADANPALDRLQFSAALTPLSMESLTAALGWPPMHGTLSAEIPEVSYRGSTLSVAGELKSKLFDGLIVAKDLKLENPFGPAPRLLTDITMQGLDLDLLTRTFSFGNITGRIDAQVVGLELSNWRPVRFDARMASSAGEYPRRISQTAVQNLSSLGGADATGAIQRSLLRFFEQFGYSEIGLSCKLEFGVCTMAGIENSAQGYTIVKGGGIPAITVLGYNRNVGWEELITRLKRVTQGNMLIK